MLNPRVLPSLLVLLVLPGHLVLPVLPVLPGHLARLVLPGQTKGPGLDESPSLNPNLNPSRNQMPNPNPSLNQNPNLSLDGVPVGNIGINRVVL